MKLQNSKYNSLVDNVGKLLAESKQKIASQINSALVTTYWNVGKHIVEFEQGGADKAKYGSELIVQLSKDLSLKYGKGFSRSNLTYMRKFYLAFPIFQTLSGKSSKSETPSHILSWSKDKKGSIELSEKGVQTQKPPKT